MQQQHNNIHNTLISSTLPRSHRIITPSPVASSTPLLSSSISPQWTHSNASIKRMEQSTCALIITSIQHHQLKVLAAFLVLTLYVSYFSSPTLFHSSVLSFTPSLSSLSPPSSSSSHSSSRLASIAARVSELSMLVNEELARPSVSPSSHAEPPSQQPREQHTTNMAHDNEQIVPTNIISSSLPPPSKYLSHVPFNTSDPSSFEYYTNCLHFLYGKIKYDAQHRIIDPPPDQPAHIDFAQTWWSSEYQDWFLYHNLFPGVVDGVFMDIGANAGVWGSNSKFFETCLNWKGICVEPNPKYTQSFKQRTCELVQECAYNTTTVLSFYQEGGHGGRVEKWGSLKVQCRPVQEIIQRSNLKPKHIHFISLDVEGSELLVLNSFPFDVYTVDVWLIESNKIDLEELESVMTLNGYSLLTNLGPDSIYVLRQRALKLPAVMPHRRQPTETKKTSKK